LKEKIDEIDAKILKMLLRESRTSFTKMAMECKITIGAVRMRYKRLKKEGVITGEVMLVNPHSLGYCHIVDLGITSLVEKQREVAEFLESKPYIAQVVVAGGPFKKYNFFGKVAILDLKKLSEIIAELESNINIKRVDAQIWVEAVNIEYPHNLVVKPLKHEPLRKTHQTLKNVEEKPIKFDETDRKIANILAKKSRTPFRKIALQLGISTKNVIQRYNRLRENVLTISTITVDLRKIGYCALAHLYLKVENRSKMSEVTTRLLEIQNLLVMIKLMGAYDLYVCIALDNFEGWFEAVQMINNIDEIKTAEPLFAPTPPSWPLNLFPSLLEGNAFQPKYWLGAQKNIEKDKPQLDKSM
jgi:DNA-binding Lrp family transcriptional regulator